MNNPTEFPFDEWLALTKQPFDPNCPNCKRLVIEANHQSHAIQKVLEELEALKPGTE